jgi:hypothetical protein
VSDQALRPLGVGEILDVAIKVYRLRFVTLIKAVTILVAPVSALGAIVQLSAEPDDISTSPGDFDTSPGSEPDLSDFATFLGALIVVAVLTFVATQVATAASLKIISGTYLAEEAEWRDSLRFALSRLGSLVWLSTITGVLLLLAFLACVVPMIYLYAAWAVAVPVLLLEDVRGRKALRRSRLLVRGRWWSTAAALLLSTLLQTIVNLVFTGVGTALVAAADNELADAVVNTVLGTAASVFTTPFAAAVTAVLYFDLRVRKEGFDLEMLARQVGVDPTDVGPSGLLAAGPPGGPPREGTGDDEPPFWPPPPGWRGGR